MKQTSRRKTDRGTNLCQQREKQKRIQMRKKNQRYKQLATSNWVELSTRDPEDCEEAHADEHMTKRLFSSTPQSAEKGEVALGFACCDRCETKLVCPQMRGIKLSAR